MKLNDIAEFVTDKISSSGISLDRYVTTDSLLQNRRGRETAQNLPPMPCALTHYRQGDVLVANIRPYLKKVWYADSEGGCSSDVLAFRAKNGHCPSFLYTVLMQDAFFDYAMSGAKGSKMPRGDKDQIMRYELPTFTPLEEENIGNMMVDIMSKINVNSQINDNLEAMAKQLYDYWFVQFDFPNEDGKPYKSSGGAMVWNDKLKREIPQGWDFCFLEDLLTIRNGRDHKHLADGIYPVYGSGGEMRKVSEYLYDGESVLMPRKGSLNNIMYVNEAFWTVDTMFYSEMKLSNCAKYIYYTIKDIDFTRWDSGTGVPSMTSSTLYSIKLVKPQNETLKKFDEMISPLFEHMKQISKQNVVLTKHRDELLPLLMNGQASVNYHLSASTSISFDISVLFLNFINGNSLYETISLDYQCFALPLYSKENTHGTIQEDKRHIQQRQRQGDKHARERFLAFFYKCTSTVHQAAFGNAWCYRGYKGKDISESK